MLKRLPVYLRAFIHIIFGPIAKLELQIEMASASHGNSEIRVPTDLYRQAIPKKYRKVVHTNLESAGTTRLPENQLYLVNYVRTIDDDDKHWVYMRVHGVTYRFSLPPQIGNADVILNDDDEICYEREGTTGLSFFDRPRAVYSHSSGAPYVPLTGSSTVSVTDIAFTDPYSIPGRGNHYGLKPTTSLTVNNFLHR